MFKDNLALQYSVAMNIKENNSILINKERKSEREKERERERESERDDKSNRCLN